MFTVYHQTTAPHAPRCSRGFDTFMQAEDFLASLGGGSHWAHKHIECNLDEPYGDIDAAFSFADEILLFASNSGEIYKAQCQMARDGASAARWQQHVRRVVLPRWQRECGSLPGLATPNAIEQTATHLATYYAEHVAECDTPVPQGWRVIEGGR